MADVPPLVHITEVAVIGDHELRLTFEDGAVGDVGFASREWRGVFEPLRDPGFFAQVSVDGELGTIVWPGDLVRPLSLSTRRPAATRSPARGTVYVVQNGTPLGFPLSG